MNQKEQGRKQQDNPSRSADHQPQKPGQQQDQQGRKPAQQNERSEGNRDSRSNPGNQPR